MQLPIYPGDSPEQDGTDDAPAPVSGALLSALLDEIHQQVKAALLYTHHRADRNTEALIEVAATLNALVATLVKQGVIEAKDLKQRSEEAAKQVKQQFAEQGMGAIRLVPEMDKYKFPNNTKVDCMARLHVCRSACCRMPFALSKQDIQENVVQWNLAHPYVIQHGGDGFCVHRDAETCHCAVHDQRPVACRAFDCENDERIWSDFEKMKLTPELEAIYAEQDKAKQAES